ncbi:hypothetical protein [Brachybacterium alimentarium]|uniref:hypothetical protein n=1 Tax=Brachybacterium alimentarium TaxID=47845 RepID=UPI003FD25EC0
MAVLVMSAGAALAEPTDTQAVRADVVQHLAESNVPDSKRDELADKIVSGEVVDADKPDAIPVSEKNWTSGGFEHWRADYTDGSFLETSVEQEAPAPKPGTISARKISGCTSTTGSGYVSRKHCFVSANGATFEASFYADFTHNGGSKGFASISRVYQPNVKAIGGTVSGIKTKVSRKKSDNRLPAEAYLLWNYKSTQGVAGGTTYLYLKVNALKEWTEVR